MIERIGRGAASGERRAALGWPIGVSGRVDVWRMAKASQTVTTDEGSGGKD